VAGTLETSDSATLLLSLARNIPGALYRCKMDRHWTMHLIGDEIERITGYPPDEFIDNRGRTFMSLVHLDDAERVEQEVIDAVAAGLQYELEYRVLTASGEYRWVLDRGCSVQGRDRLWLDGVIFDITERRSFEEAARRAETAAAVALEVSESRRRIVRAGDEARQRIERDLHDGAQQTLVSSLMTLRLAQRQVGDDPARAAALMKTTQELLEQGLSDLRDLAHGIHPSLLADHGVAAAVAALGAHASVPVEVVDDLHDRLAGDVEAALYFTAAEAVTNALKHASATQITVHLGRENGGVCVNVFDDGVGGARIDGRGLRGLTDRLATLSGTIDVTSHTGAGTRLTARIPV
jgi:PAS domain S-box-containing protein